MLTASNCLCTFGHGLQFVAFPFISLAKNRTQRLQSCWSERERKRARSVQLEDGEKTSAWTVVIYCFLSVNVHKERHNCVGGSHKLCFLCLLLFWHAAISHTVWRAPDNLVLIISRCLRFCVFCTFCCQIKFPPTQRAEDFLQQLLQSWCCGRRQ